MAGLFAEAAPGLGVEAGLAPAAASVPPAPALHQLRASLRDAGKHGEELPRLAWRHPLHHQPATGMSPAGAGAGCPCPQRGRCSGSRHRVPPGGSPPAGTSPASDFPRSSGLEGIIRGHGRLALCSGELLLGNQEAHGVPRHSRARSAPQQPHVPPGFPAISGKPC